MSKEPLIVFNKIVYNSTGNYIITLKLDNSKTNENRDNVIDPLNARFRCDKVYVNDIQNKYTIDNDNLNNN